MSAAVTTTSVFISNLPWDLSNEELAGHMSTAGHVEYASIKTYTDGRSKGVAIVRYSTAEEAAEAVASLTDSELKGRKITVREDREASGAPRPPRAAAAAGTAAAPRAPRAAAPVAAAAATAAAPRAPRAPRPAADGAAAAPKEHAPPVEGATIYVGNLPWSVTWFTLKDAFAAYGPVYSKVIMGIDGRSKGFGIVRFASAADATRAIAEMNNTELEGRTIFVKLDEPRPRRAADGTAAAGTA